MKVINEYPLYASHVGPQTIYLPESAKVVKVEGNISEVKLFVLVDRTKSAPKLRTFQICDTAETIYKDRVIYIDSFRSDFGIRHVVEILN